MKRFVSLLMIFAMLLIFVSCGEDSISGSKIESISSDVNETEIVYKEGVWYDKNWDDYYINRMKFDYQCIPDKEAAILYGKYLAEVNSINASLYKVFYDTEDKIWIILYTSSLEHPGAEIGFAVRQDNGEIIKSWFLD